MQGPATKDSAARYRLSRNGARHENHIAAYPDDLDPVDVPLRRAAYGRLISTLDIR